MEPTPSQRILALVLQALTAAGLAILLVGVAVGFAMGAIPRA